MMIEFRINGPLKQYSSNDCINLSKGFIHFDPQLANSWSLYWYYRYIDTFSQFLVQILVHPLIADICAIESGLRSHTISHFGQKLILLFASHYLCWIYCRHNSYGNTSETKQTKQYFMKMEESFVEWRAVSYEILCRQLRKCWHQTWSAGVGAQVLSNWSTETPETSRGSRPALR